MAQGLCWLFAKLADLTCVVASKSGKVALLQEKPIPAWARGWFLRLLRWAGHIRAGEDAAAMSFTGAPLVLLPVQGEESGALIARAQFALHGTLRVEYRPGSFALFRARSRREATDFAFLKNCAEN